MNSNTRIIDSEKLVKLADSLELAQQTEAKALKLCDLAEKFAQKYEKSLVKTEFL